MLMQKRYVIKLFQRNLILLLLLEFKYWGLSICDSDFVLQIVKCGELYFSLVMFSGQF